MPIRSNGNARLKKRLSERAQKSARKFSILIFELATTNAMSALPPKADMCSARGHVCFEASPFRLDDFPDLVDAVAFRHNHAGAVFELALQHKLRLAV